MGVLLFMASWATVIYVLDWFGIARNMFDRDPGFFVLFTLAMNIALWFAIREALGYLPSA